VTTPKQREHSLEPFKQESREAGEGSRHRRLARCESWRFKVVKLSLNLSEEEQRTWFLKRIDLPEKNWKFSSAG
jgi:hypothetical protein